MICIMQKGGLERYYVMCQIPHMPLFGHESRGGKSRPFDAGFGMRGRG